LNIPKQSRRLVLLPLFLAVPAAAQSVAVTSVTNLYAPNSAIGICPGAVAAIHFTSNQPLNVGLSADFGAEPAPYLAESAGGGSGFVAVQVPWDVGTGPTSVTLFQGGAISMPFPVMITSDYCPAFVINGVNRSNVGSGGSEAYYTDTSPAQPGDTAFVLMTGLGPINPVVPIGAYGAAPTTSNPIVNVGTEQAQVLSSIYLSPSALTPYGGYQVAFAVPSDLTPGDYPVTVSAGAVVSQSVNLPVGPASGAPFPKILLVQNSASSQVKDATNGAAPGSFVILAVSNLGNVNSPSNIFPMSSFEGIQVFFNGEAVPLYNLATFGPLTYITVGTPPAAAGLLPPNYGVQISVQGQTDPFPSGDNFILTAATDAGIFTFPFPEQPTLNAAAAQFAGTAWDVMPVALADAYNLPPCTALSISTPCGQPAHPGDSIVIYYTGGGLATPNGDPNGQPLELGAVAPPDGSVIYHTVVTPTVTFGGTASQGGIAAQVGFSGLVPGSANEYQVNVMVPQFSGAFQPGNDVVLAIAFGDAAPAVASIAVAAR